MEIFDSNDRDIKDTIQTAVQPSVIPGRIEKMGHFLNSDPESTLLPSKNVIIRRCLAVVAPKDDSGSGEDNGLSRSGKSRIT